MKVYPRDPNHRLSIEIIRILCELRRFDTLSSFPSSSVGVIVANGSPDNIVIALLCSVLNHGFIVDLLFPNYKHISVFDYIQHYISLGYRSLLVVIDQEDYSLKDLAGLINKKLTSNPIDLSERVAVVSLRYGGRDAGVIIVVNGINEQPTSKHTIEDHLVQLAKDLGVSISGENNSKNAWGKISREQQLTVFRAILNKGNLKYFDQHVKALKLLRGIMRVLIGGEYYF